jgi:hypothetical protein
MDTAQLPGGSSVSFTNEIREERKEFLRVAGFCGAEARRKIPRSLEMTAQDASVCLYGQ